MALPVSTRFDSFDWNSRYASTADGTDREIIDGTDPLTGYVVAVPPGVVATASAINIVADATSVAANKVVEVALQVASPVVGPIFTFEFDISLTAALPRNFDSVDNRLFVGASRAQGKCAGFLLSYQGVALATHPKDPYPSVLGGSAAHLFDDNGDPVDSLTIRGVVDEDGRLTVYLAQTSVAYDASSGAAWADEANLTASYNLPAKAAAVPALTSVIVYGSARSASYIAQGGAEQPPVGDETIFGLSSLRLSTAKILPLERPVAAIGAVVQALVGARVPFNGASSYDKTGLALTYLWEIVSAPMGSTATLDGGLYASTVDTSGVDLIGTDAANNRIRFTFKTPTDVGNDYTVVIAAGISASSPLDVSLSGTTLTVALATDGTGVATTTADELASAFYNVLSPAYAEAAVAVLDVAVLSPAGTGVVPAGTYALTGGAGSTLDLTALTPDVLGAYVVSLVVDNGVKASPPTLVTLTATATGQLLQHRPSAGFVFDYLPDFWKLVKDKQQLPAMWSAVAQVVSADMVTAWQNDYSKALRDISRTYQRRWMSYDFKVDVPSDDGVHIVTPDFVGELRATAVPDTANNAVSTATLQVVTQNAPATTGKYLLRSNLFPASVVDVIGVENSVPAAPLTGVWKLTAAGRQIPVYKVLEGSTNGRFVVDPTLPVVSPQVSTLFSNVSSSLNAARVGDIIRVFINGTSQPPVLLPVLSVNPSGLANTLKLNTAARVVDGLNYVWELLRTPTLSDLQFVRTPYIKIPATSDVSTEGLGIGDYAGVTVLNPYTAEEIPLHLPILAVDSSAVFVDWTVMLQALNLAASINAAVGEKTSWRAADVALLAITVTGFHRHKQSPTVEDLLSTPLLGTSTLAASMKEGRDYSVVDNAIVLRDRISGTVTCTAGSNVVTFSTTSDIHPDVTLDMSAAASAAAGVHTLVIEDGNSGVYGIANKNAVGGFILDRVMRWSGTFTAHAPRNSAYAPGGSTLWAEISYFDNYKAIESNFGLLVGISKHELEQCTTTADYLSVVKAAWFAFVSGPTLGNLQLATQAFLGLMYAEVDSQVVHVVEPTATAPGLVTLQDAVGHPYTYEYPYGATLATNPTTGNIIAPYPAVSDETTLSAAAAAALADAKVPAYTRLFSAVSVDDYISDPLLIAKELPGQEVLRKYHTFVVDVPLTLARDTNVFSCIRRFLEQAKPAHTNFILVGSLVLGDTLDLEDTLTLHPTIRMVDTPHSSPFFAIKSGTDAFGQPIVLAADEALIWPKEDTLTQHGHPPGASVTAVPLSALLVPNMDLSAYLTPGGKVRIESDDGTAVLGYIEREVLTFTATEITLTSAYFGTGGLGMDIQVALTADDVYERYESGYAEGILDDYSGDGSWNARYRQLNPVNALASDIDVATSLIWVPVTKLTAGAHAELEFVVGESIDILNDTVVDTVSIWAASPPIVVHIGAGVHPQMPFGIDSPQNAHPETYLLLGFTDFEDDTKSNFGDESRLDAIAEAVLRLVGPVRLQGRTSGAIATPTTYIDRTNLAHSKYFLLETIFSADKLSEWNPKSDPGFIITRYLPAGGTTVDALQNPAGDVEPFNTATHATNPLYYLHAIQYSQELQKHPYDPLVPDNEQFVPSLGPGIFMDWDLTGLPGPPTKATFNWRYGYVDVGDLSLTPTVLSAFTPDTNATDVENTHIGTKALARKSWHFTSGFTEFVIPAPVIRKATSPGSGAWDVRVEGYYFVDDDASRVLVPTLDPTSYDGGIGGSWLFLRDTVSLVETPVATWTFETGLNIGKTVLGADGALQTSTGHVLEFMVPVLPGLGVYDIIVRNYRPWTMVAAGTQRYHMDEGVAIAAYYHDPFGYSGVGPGTGVWEG